MCSVKIVSFPLTVQSFDVALKVSPAGIGGLACRPSLIYETALTKVPMAIENYIL